MANFVRSAEDLLERHKYAPLLRNKSSASNLLTLWIGNTSSEPSLSH
jgi:hypothetical protein